MNSVQEKLCLVDQDVYFQLSLFFTLVYSSIYFSVTKSNIISLLFLWSGVGVGGK